MTAATLPVAEDNRGARIGRAYALVAALIGREWVSRPELDRALGHTSEATTRRHYLGEATGKLFSMMDARRRDT